ncbi:MAG TPA: hypothetical protein VM346_01165 [Sphingomicrobium sp.]|nr:hypothetical protein [Sphingomicrobium sp.]
MATRAHQTPPLDVALSVIPSLPRPLLSRLVLRAIERLDELDGDPDFEENDAEDSFVLSWWASHTTGPGCPASDPGGGNVEDAGEDIDEREPDHDAEIETWAHPDDHPAELFIGNRPNH